MKFVGEAPTGHLVPMDTTPEVGGESSGPRPGDLPLVALGGCTGMDIVSILKKMRVNFDSFEMVIDGENRKEHPRYFEKVHIRYIFKGRGLDESKIKEAVELSQDKFCSVSAMMKKSAELTYDIEIVSS
jgi:putative redox protein